MQRNIAKVSMTFSHWHSASWNIWGHAISSRQIQHHGNGGKRLFPQLDQSLGEFFPETLDWLPAYPSCTLLKCKKYFHCLAEWRLMSPSFFSLYSTCTLGPQQSPQTLSQTHNTHNWSQHSCLRCLSHCEHHPWSPESLRAVIFTCSTPRTNKMRTQTCTQSSVLCLPCCHILTSWFTRTETNPVGYTHTSLFHSFCLSSLFPWATAPSRGDGRRWGPAACGTEGNRVRQIEDVDTLTSSSGW